MYARHNKYKETTVFLDVNTLVYMFDVAHSFLYRNDGQIVSRKDEILSAEFRLNNLVCSSTPFVNETLLLHFRRIFKSFVFMPNVFSDAMVSKVRSGNACHWCILLCFCDIMFDVIEMYVCVFMHLRVY